MCGGDTWKKGQMSPYVTFHHCVGRRQGALKSFGTLLRPSKKGKHFKHQCHRKVGWGGG